MAGSVVVAVGYVMAAYSAVSAIQALKDGNILGAVAAGLGAYTGLNVAGVFGNSVSAAIPASVGEVAGEGLMVGTGALEEAASAGLEAGIGGAAESVTPFLGIEASAPSLATTAFDAAGKVAETAVQPDILATQSKGILGDFGSAIGNVVDKVRAAGGEVVGQIQEIGGGKFMDQAGTVFDQAGNILQGKGASGVANMALKGIDAYMNYQAQQDQMDYLKERQAKLDEAQANRGKAPTGNYQLRRLGGESGVLGGTR